MAATNMFVIGCLLSFLNPRLLVTAVIYKSDKEKRDPDGASAERSKLKQQLFMFLIVQAILYLVFYIFVLIGFKGIHFNKYGVHATDIENCTECEAIEDSEFDEQEEFLMTTNVDQNQSLKSGKQKAILDIDNTPNVKIFLS